MKKIIMAAALGATMLTGIGVAVAQDAPSARGMKADVNGDGFITREEALAAADARFAKRDANHDGQLTREEHHAGRERHGKRGHHRGMGGPELHARLLERFDADKDGKLSDAERQTARAAWQERRGGQADGARAERRQQFVQRFDTDKDGKLSATEREAARAAMPHRRGPGGPGGKRGGDANGDGVLTQTEARAAALARFDRVDANRDGRIDAQERTAMREKMKEMRGKFGRHGHHGGPRGEAPPSSDSNG